MDPRQTLGSVLCFVWPLTSLLQSAARHLYSLENSAVCGRESFLDLQTSVRQGPCTVSSRKGPFRRSHRESDIYRPKRSCEGYGFTGVCLSTGGEGAWSSGVPCPGGCAWSLGGAWSQGVPGPGGAGIPACTEADPPGHTATAADGTHPTGTHSCSCSLMFSLCQCGWSHWTTEENNVTFVITTALCEQSLRYHLHLQLSKRWAIALTNIFWVLSE